MSNEAFNHPSLVEDWLENLEQNPSQVQIADTNATSHIALPKKHPVGPDQFEQSNTTHPEVRYKEPTGPNMVLTSFPAPEMYIQDLSSPDSSVFADSLFLMLMRDVKSQVNIPGPDPVYLERHKDLMEALRLKFAIREAMEASIADHFHNNIEQLPESRHHTDRARALLSEFETQPLPTLDDMYAQLLFANAQLAGPELGIGEVTYAQT